MKEKEVDTINANAIRALAIDMITHANSGHPGLPLSAADIAYVLFKNHLRFDPRNPDWINRDRFILSAGHGSALLYSLLYFFGFGLEMDEIKRFRQLNSKTPGHPEYGHTCAVETTTGPLGQGFANAVGMAWAEKILSEKFNRPKLELIDHRTYVLCGEGDLMEGISYEAASLAGHLKLKKLICILDFNKITIEGSTEITFTEDVEKRFIAQRWNVLNVNNGYNQEEINKAIIKAQKSDSPSLIIVKTHIGYKSPKQDSNKAHGEPLSWEDLVKTKENLGWQTKNLFEIPHEIMESFSAISLKKSSLFKKWEKIAYEYAKTYPELYKEFRLSLDCSKDINVDFKFDTPIATRDASHKILNSIAGIFPSLYGGSADLAPSTKTKIDALPERNFHFGVREHAMGAITNGMAIHGGIRPFCSTFLVFLDYMKTPVRLASMMKAPSIFIFTHDSIAVGEDGPTHQPVEHIMSLRLIPGITELRPADAIETKKAWEYICSTKQPVCLILTRQKVPLLFKYEKEIEENFSKGAYFLYRSDNPDILIVATGSEVHLALDAAEKLAAKSIAACVVSMPSYGLFSCQPQSYKEEILMPGVPKLAIEAGRTIGWSDLLGEKCEVMGVENFGKSAPEKHVYSYFGLTVDNITQKVIDMLK